MAKVELKNLTKKFDNVVAVNKMNTTFEDQEFVVLVGPSGCGKTTTLRMIAGLEEVTEGEIYIGDRLVNDVPPKDRDIAMVFQNYALYPHMNVYDNMAFGLKLRRTPKQEIIRRVNEAASILKIEELLKRKPKQLSGGQRQRVALGRAIVRDPKVFLMDEPLSNLDAKLRVQMRAEIGSLHSRLSATMVYVTHDQVEAMTMGDKIVVMKGGIIQQIGNPLTLYNMPINRFVAGFIGSPPMNIAVAKVTEEGGKIVVTEEGMKVTIEDERKETLKSYVGKELLVGIRPEDLDFTTSPVANNNMSAKVIVIEPLGAETQLHINTGSHTFTTKNEPTISVKVGDTVNFTPRLNKLHFFDMETERSLFFSEG